MVGVVQHGKLDVTGQLIRSLLYREVNCVLAMGILLYATGMFDLFDQSPNSGRLKKVP